MKAEPIELAKLAAVFQNRGNLFIYQQAASQKNKIAWYRLTVSLDCKSQADIEALKMQFNGKAINKKGKLIWMAFRTDAVNFLASIYPFCSDDFRKIFDNCFSLEASKKRVGKAGLKDNILKVRQGLCDLINFSFNQIINSRLEND